ncbi:MAG TPA: hypothetical protein VD770_01755, partial [Coxiellaceae bacterium]|nr:hypothetical protein [Coxiellaceae bacterium]
MQSFATTPVGFKDTIRDSFQNWFRSLKLVWPLILLIFIIREYYCPVCENLHPDGWTAQALIALL